MRLLVDATPLGSGRGGDETWLAGLLEGLALHPEAADRVQVLLRPGVSLPAGAQGLPVLRGTPSPGPWHFVRSLPAVVSRERPDQVLTVTHAPLRSSAARLVVVGDLSFVHRPADYPRATAWRLRTLVRRHCRDAERVLVPSQTTRQDVLATFGLSPERVVVVPNRVLPPAPVQDRAAAAELLAAAGVRAPYVVQLGNRHPRKNVARLVRSFAAMTRDPAAPPGVQLVLAGARWWGGADESAAIEALAPGVVVELGRVSDDVRRLLLQGAEALAYVSLFEGFGLPAVEALAEGTPVLASATTSLPEVCGDAALLVDPGDDDAVTAGLLRILTDTALRDRLRAAGPVQAATWSTARVGAAAWSVLDPHHQPLPA